MINLSPQQLDFFNEKGYLVLEDLLTPEEVLYYRDIYEQFLGNHIDVARYRSDLGAHVEEAQAGDSGQPKERITQIMLLSKVFPEILDQPLHRRTGEVARQLMGLDMALDFDMLIDKAPYTAAVTPWHQDCAYWITMPDTRAASCWLALDNAVLDNGCMWYVEGSHKLPVRTHRLAGKGGGALECDASEDEGTPVEIKAGSCVWHHGGTLHYSRGNTTGRRRRAFITNYRPQAMIDYERMRGFDHSGERDLRDERAKKA